MNRTHESDPDRLNDIWQHALRLASEHEKHAKYVELADDVAHRYVHMTAVWNARIVHCHWALPSYVLCAASLSLSRVPCSAEPELVVLGVVVKALFTNFARTCTSESLVGDAPSSRLCVSSCVVQLD